MAVSMRPMTLGEILDKTIQLYRRHFLLFIGISVVPAAIDILISGGLGVFFGSRLSAFALAADPGSASKPPDWHAYLLFFGVFAAFLLIGVPILLGVFSLALSALNHTALALNRGEILTVRGAYRLASRHFWRNAGILFLQFLLAGIIPGLVLGGLFMVAAIVGAVLFPKVNSPAAAISLGLVIFGISIAVVGVCIWIWIRFCLAFPASIAESKSAWPSMQRSVQLSKGTRGRIFVMYLMVGILTMVVYYALIIPVDLAMGLRIDKLFAVTHTAGYMPVVVQTVNLFISFLERAFVMPIYAIALVLFYADQRTRNEGYDIEQMMAHAGWSETPMADPLAFEPATPAAVNPSYQSEPGASDQEERVS